VRLLIDYIESSENNGVEVSANIISNHQEVVLEDRQTPFSFYNGGQNANALGFDMSELMLSGDLDFLTNFSNRGFY